jgi:hypothetical protein
MVLLLQTLLEIFESICHVITFVKNNDSNLGTTPIRLWSIIDFEPLKLLCIMKVFDLGM